ncbi:MAG: hypothetical protein ACXABY_02650 [Candidatus Thorarchaeota archaeon]|jgi:hypothetical protein
MIITDVLVVHKKGFKSPKEAHDWNKRTGVCLNLDLMTLQEIEKWDGEVIWVPLRSKNGE